MLNGTFNITHLNALQILDKEITQTLLTGEEQCAKCELPWNPWLPKLCDAGLQLSYWKKKFQKSQNKLFQWHILDSLFNRTTIALQNHYDRNSETIKPNLWMARWKWREVRKTRGWTLTEFFTRASGWSRPMSQHASSTSAQSNKTGWTIPTNIHPETT